MKKYMSILFAVTLFVTLLGFNINSASAFVSGCSGTVGFSTTTGESCNIPGLPAGCTSTQGFSPTTGQSCNVTFPPGCSSNVGFSPTTGQSCSIGSNFPPGCNSNVGFSPTTGQSCSGTTSPQPVYLPGCSSYSGFSPTTGQACNGTTITSPTVVVNASPSTVQLGGASTISWSSTGNNLSCSISPSNGLVSASGSQVVYPTSTTSYYSVTCTDPSGMYGTGSATVYVIAPTYRPGCSSTTGYSSVDGQYCGTSQQPPVISGINGPQSLSVNQQGTWTVQASDPTNGSLGYYVTWGDEFLKYQNPSYQSSPMPSQQSATFTHSYAQAGTYTATFSVGNLSGNFAKTSLTVNVGGVTNVAQCSLTAQATNVKLSQNNNSWGFDVFVNATNPPANSSGWTANFQGYAPVVTSYGTLYHYGDFFVSAGSLQFTAQDQVNSNCTTTITVPPPPVVNSTTNLPATIIPSSSTTSQFIPVGNTGATSATKATYNFTSTSGAATISELQFFSASDANSITSVTVGGVSAPMVSGTADLTGLNISVPNGGSGLSQDVFVSYSGVGANGVRSGALSTISLTYVKYISNGIASITHPNINASTMKLVGSKPTIALSASGATLTTGLVDVGHITVTADPKGNIILNQLPIDVAMSGFITLSSYNANSIIVKDNSNNTITTTNTQLNSTQTSGQMSSVVSFNGGYVIPAGTSQTFKIFLQLSVSSNASVSLGLISPSLFSWTDVAGNASAPITTDNSTYFYNYPMNSVSVSGSVTTNTSTVLGDVNGDGIVTIGDALQIQLHVNGTALLTGQALINADVNRDGQVTSRDSTLVANYAGGLITSFPYETQPVPIPPPPASTYSFTPNGGTLVAGRDAWTFSLNNANPGDKLEVDAWKNGGYVGKFTICTVQSLNSPIPSTTCNASAVPQTVDIGAWSENVYINGIQKGSIGFNVVSPSLPPTGECIISNTLQLGSTGNEVVCLQTRLGISADGKFGPMTKAAVVSFQNGAGLVADGEVGPITIRALEK